MLSIDAQVANNEYNYQCNYGQLKWTHNSECRGRVHSSLAKVNSVT